MSKSRMIEKEVIVSVDQGTQSTRLSYYDKEMQCVCSCSAKLRQYREKPGWCEQRPHEIMKQIYGLSKSCMKKALSKYGRISIKGFGVATQRETVIVWDKVTGEPLYNALVWRDTRTNSMVNEMIAEMGGPNAYKKLTGLPISNYVSALKIKWLMENVPGVAEKLKNGSAIAGTVDTWIVWNLTGGGGAAKVAGNEGSSVNENHMGCHITDVTNASRTYLMDMNTCKWSDFLCDKFGIPMNCLPKICSSSEVYGYINNKHLDEYMQKVPVAGIAGDQQAACVGHGMFNVGQSKCTYGTGAFIFVHTGENRAVTDDNLFCTPCYQLGGQPVMFALEGAIKTAGAGITFMKDVMKIIDHPKETVELFQSVKNNVDGKTNDIIYVPNSSGSFASENENWYINKKAEDFDLRRDRAYVVKALFEAVGFQLHEIMDKVLRFLKVEIPFMYVDGGMTGNEQFLQFTANLMNCIIKRPYNSEVTSVGAAVLAGLGCKFWQNAEEIEGLIGRQRVNVFYPQNHLSLLDDDNDDHELDYMAERPCNSMCLMKRLSSFCIREHRLTLWKSIVFNQQCGNWVTYDNYGRPQNVERLLLKETACNNKHEECFKNIKDVDYANEGLETAAAALNKNASCAWHDASSCA